jgi:hypothetical protein|nr:MAG TPA: hypothetical protein [Caudoviricetes sp.]
MSTKKVIEIAKELYDSCISGSSQNVEVAIYKLQEYVIGQEKDVDLAFMTTFQYPFGSLVNASVLIPTRVCSTYEFDINVVQVNPKRTISIFVDIQKAASNNANDFYSFVIRKPSDFECVVMLLKHLYEKENIEIN